MSLFFGGGSKSKPQFTGLAAQTSTSAVPIPIAWGQNRIAPNIIWEGDFKSHKQKQGKGGGKSVTSYTYSASFQLGICWGEAHNIVTVWKDTSKVANTSSKLGGVTYNYFLGTTPQDPWGYLTTKHPDEALGYSGIVHVDMANYDLGQSNALGQHSFEVQALRWDTGLGGSASALDADPALIVEDFLNNDSFGVGFDLSVVANLYSTADAATTGDSAYQTYCQAMGFALSPVLSDQETAIEILGRWAKLTNTAITWNGYQLKYYPYGPDTVTGNGVTYVPDFPVRYTLTDKDFLSSGDDPVTFDRVDPADAYNSLSMIISNRANEYNDLPVPWRDQGLVDQYGLRKADDLNASEITELEMAQVIVALVGQRTAYIRNTFSFKLPPKFCLLEPMDIVTIVDSRFGTFTVLLQTVDENDDDELEITADEYIDSVSTPTANTGQTTSNTPKNTAVLPGPVNPPIIFEPPSELAGTPQIWCAVSGGDGTTVDENWGGAIVWISTDGTSYVQIGEIENIARQGILSAALATYAGTNPDATNTLSVDLNMSGGELEDEASATDAANGSNLCYVDGELISFEVPTLTATYEYDLGNLYRGLYGSTIGAHSSGTNFARLDDAIFKYELPSAYIGQTLYLKFQSVNVFGLAAQDLADVTAYTYTPTGAGYGTGSGGVPAIPTGFSGSAGSGYNRLTWDEAPSNDNVTAFQLWRAAGSGSSFGSASLLATVSGSTTDYTDVTATAGSPYTYFLVAVNAAGSSTNTSGVSLTSSSVGGTLWRVAATGTGASQGITLPYSDVDENGVFVYVNGLRVETTEYSISGTTLTMTSNASGDSIEIIGIVQ